MHNRKIGGNADGNEQPGERVRNIIDMQVNLEEENALEIETARTEPGIFYVDHFLEQIPSNLITKHRISEHNNLKIPTARP